MHFIYIYISHHRIKTYICVHVVLDYTYIKYSPTYFRYLITYIRLFFCDVYTFYRGYNNKLKLYHFTRSLLSQYCNTVQTFYGIVDIIT